MAECPKGICLGVGIWIVWSNGSYPATLRMWSQPLPRLDLEPDTPELFTQCQDLLVLWYNSVPQLPKPLAMQVCPQNYQVSVPPNGKCTFSGPTPILQTLKSLFSQATQPKVIKWGLSFENQHLTPTFLQSTAESYLQLFISPPHPWTVYEIPRGWEQRGRAKVVNQVGTKF